MKILKSEYPIETFIPEYLNISDKVEQVFLFGESGATIMDEFRLPVFALWASNGRDFIIMIAVLQWDYHHHVKC